MAKSKIEFRAGLGARFGDKKAKIYGKYLMGLSQNNKDKLKPEIVVRAAQPKDSPIHECFEWDNSRAGNSWRKWQAQQLMSKLDLVIEYKGEEKIQRAFFNIETETKIGRAYIPLEIVFKDRGMRNQVIEQAMKELTGWQGRYESYQELADIFEAIENTKGKLNGGKNA